jgi:phage terminase large subunit-like protein
VCSVPSYITSAGQDCIDLAASAGLYLDPWQQDVLIDALGEREDGNWSAFEVGLIVSRQNGKGSILEARELAGLFLFGERLILHSAHEFKTATEAFRRVLSLVENTDDLRKKVKKVQIGHGDEGIELRNGARLRFVARSTGSGRGFSGDLVILDEAYALTAKQVEALLPTMSARPNPQLWYTSSPSLDADSGAHLISVRDRGRAGGPGLAYFDYGVEGDLQNLGAIDLDDRNLWRSANPAFGIRITEEFIARERAAMTDEGFARERLGIWPAVGSGSVISMAQWAKLADPDSRRDGDIALAIDIAPLRDHASISVFGRRADGIGHARLIDYAPGTDWLLTKLRERIDELSPIAVAMGRGTYESLKTELADMGLQQSEDPEHPRRGDLAVTSAQDMAAACGQFIDAVRQGSLRYVPVPALDESVSGAKIRQLGDVIAWARKDATTDTSPLVTVTLARWAFTSRIDLVDAYDAMDNIW